MNRIIIKIAEDFTKSPGFRLRRQGEFSGEQFREEYLEKYFDGRADDSAIIVVNLDGALGYATSFLEEAFGGLIRKFPYIPNIEQRIEIISKEEPYLVDDVKRYMANVREDNKRKG